MMLPKKDINFKLIISKIIDYLVELIDNMFE